MTVNGSMEQLEGDLKTHFAVAQVLIARLPRRPLLFFAGWCFCVLASEIVASLSLWLKTQGSLPTNPDLREIVGQQLNATDNALIQAQH